MLGCFASDPFASQCVIAHGIRDISKVENHVIYAINTRIYPNPAIDHLNVLSEVPGRPVHLFDLLGNEAANTVLDAFGRATLDVSSLPRGTYSLMIDIFGTLQHIGKVAVVAK
jgi:hypothetical protein